MYDFDETAVLENINRETGEKASDSMTVLVSA